MKTLEKHYYLDNFKTLIAHAQCHYYDLLTDDEKNWLAGFEKLSIQAQSLLVRMYSRKGNLFRSDKLQYDEIGETTAPLQELEQAQFIWLNPVLSAYEMGAELLTKPEICSIYAIESKTLSKQALLDHLLLHDPDCTQRPTFTIVQLSHEQVLNILCVLFFANNRQDLTQFVTSELGLQNFERYALSPERRFFQNRSDVDQLISIGEIKRKFDEERASLTFEELNTLNEQLSGTSTNEYVERRRQHLVNDIARQLERLGHLEVALSFFQSTSLPPSRERQVRIHVKRKELALAHQLLEQMLRESTNVDENEIAQRIIKRNRAQFSIPIDEKTIDEKREFHVIPVWQERVEYASLRYFEELYPQSKIYYLENHLICGLLGLALWPAIFADVQGAFINAYQSAPLDLYSSRFVEKREKLVSSLLARIKSGDTGYLYEILREKKGLQNPFVNWSIWDSSLLASALNSIDHHSLHAIFSIMLKDLRHYRTGFPDLVAFHDTTFEWFEIKGPGDKLQENQKRWLRHFNELNISYRVCYIRAV